MIGIDLVYIPEFKSNLDSGGEAFIEKAFSLSEISSRRAEHLAGLWAAKEAVIKVSDSKFAKMTDIVISHDKSGRPSAVAGNHHYDISISHHGDYAVAVAQKVVS